MHTINRHLRAAAYLLLVGVILFCAAAPMLKLSERGYRDDEAWAVYRSMNSPQAIVSIVLPDVKPPLFYILLSGWIGAFGHDETITRYLTRLFLLVTLAAAYQLGRQLYGRAAGVWTAFLLGTLPFAQYYAYEVNTYSLMLMTTTGAGAALLAYLTTQRPRYALGVIAFGLVAVFTHYYSVYTVLALAAFALAYTRHVNRMWWRVFSLFAILGIAFTVGWGLVLLHTMMGFSVGGDDQFISGGIPGVLAHLYTTYRSQPPYLLTIAVIVGLLTPAALIAGRMGGGGTALRGSSWRRGYPVTVIAALLTLAALLHLIQPSITARNLIVLLPYVAALGGLGMAYLPVRAQAIVALLLVVFAITTVWTPPLRATYNEMITFMGADFAPDDAVILDMPDRADQAASTYYVRERNPGGVTLPADRVTHVIQHETLPRMQPLFPRPLGRLAFDGSPQTQASLTASLQGRQQVWHFQIRQQPHSAAVVDALAEQFAVRRVALIEEAFTATLWQRPPDATADFRFGEQLEFISWRALNGVAVTACDDFVVESWWRGIGDLNPTYSLGVKLVTEDGTVLSNPDNQLSHTLSGQWHPNTMYVDESRVTVPCDAAPGAYNLLFVAYDVQQPESPLIATLADDPNAVIGDLTYITTVNVQPAG
jgi:hypothetical protein